MTLKFDGWPRKNIGHLFYITSSFVHHLKLLGEFKLELLSRNAQFRSKSAILGPYDLDIWWMTLKNNRTPLLWYFKLCASFDNLFNLRIFINVKCVKRRKRCVAQNVLLKLFILHLFVVSPVLIYLPMAMHFVPLNYIAFNIGGLADVYGMRIGTQFNTREKENFPPWSNICLLVSVILIKA